MTEEYLRSVPLFQHFHGEDIKRLAEALKEVRIAKGTMLFQKGEPGDALYIIKSGKVKIYLSSHLGEEIILAIFSHGDFLGEISLLDGRPRSAHAVAMEDTDILTLSREDFSRCLKESREAMGIIINSLCQRLRKTDDLLEDTCFLKITNRFAKKLVKLAHDYGHSVGQGVRIDLTLTQKDLAAMIGATRESVNKQMKILREKGMVMMEGHLIYITDMARLKKRALWRE
jgi:CRP-like cAMP-binding protein